MVARQEDAFPGGVRWHDLMDDIVVLYLPVYGQKRRESRVIVAAKTL